MTPDSIEIGIRPRGQRRDDYQATTSASMQMVVSASPLIYWADPILHSKLGSLELLFLPLLPSLSLASTSTLRQMSLGNGGQILA